MEQPLTVETRTTAFKRPLPCPLQPFHVVLLPLGFSLPYDKERQAATMRFHPMSCLAVTFTTQQIG